jgi:hypothetical protein
LYPSLVTDELRVLNYPRTATQVRDTWFGTDNVSVLLPQKVKPNLTPTAVSKNNSPAPPPSALINKYILEEQLSQSFKRPSKSSIKKKNDER